MNIDNTGRIALDIFGEVLGDTAVKFNFIFVAIVSTKLRTCCLVIPFPETTEPWVFDVEYVFLVSLSFSNVLGDYVKYIIIEGNSRSISHSFLFVFLCLAICSYTLLFVN